MVISARGTLEGLLKQLGVSTVGEAEREISRLKAKEWAAENRRKWEGSTFQPARPAKGRSPPVWRFRVARWEWIETQMQGRLDPVPKMVPTLRVYVPLEDQPDGPGYWDITRKRAYTMLEPVLQQAQETGAYVELRQMGKGFRSFDALSFYPAQR